MSLETAYCICTTDKTKTQEAMRGKFIHNLRLRDVKNADPSKREENEILIGPTYEDVFKMTKEEALSHYENGEYRTYEDIDKDLRKDVEDLSGKKVRKDAVRQVEVVLTYSSLALDKVNVDQWKEANVAWLKQHFGEKNVISAVLHMDETLPHIHAIITPIDESRGVPSYNAKQWLGGKRRMAEMQTEYAEAMSPFGLERGEKNTRATHEDLHKFYTALNNVVSRDPPLRQNYKTQEAYEMALLESYKEMNMTIFALQEKLKRLEIVNDTREANTAYFNMLAKQRINEVDEKIGQIEIELNSSLKSKKTVEYLKEGIERLKEDDPEKAEKFIRLLNETIQMGKERVKKRKKEDAELEEKEEN